MGALKSSVPGTVIKKSTIENILGLSFTQGNKVKLLKSGEETFTLILEAVSGARSNICIEFYIFKDDDTGKKLAEALKRKAKEGVNVYLLYDHFGSFLTSRRFWSDLKRSGIHVKVSHPFRWSAPRGYIYRNHKKLLLIDGQTAFLGGFNIADEYHGYFKKRTKLWRDTGVYLEGPIASKLLSIFMKSWSTWKGRPIRTDPLPQASTGSIPVIPVFASSRRAKRRMRKLYTYSIKNAQENISLTTPYFIPGRKILKALINTSRRGVDCRLLLQGETDVRSVYYAGRRYYRRLLKAGVKIYNYKGSILHAKTAVFDGYWSIVGSTNLDSQSLRRNEESNAGILDRDFSGYMNEVFQNDLENSIEINAEKWKERPLYEKLLEKLFYLIMRRL
jgi:cardiolipin synthase